MEIFVMSAIVSVILKLLLMCKWSLIIFLSGIVGIILTLIGCFIPVESHIVYQHGLRGSSELYRMRISHTPSWQNAMLISFFLVPVGSFTGYAIYMWLYFLHCGV